MSADLTPELRTAIRTAQAAHPDAESVERIVTALSNAGLLMSPTAAAELRETALSEAADWLAGVGERNAAYLLRTCDVKAPETTHSDEPVPYVLTDKGRVQ